MVARVQRFLEAVSSERCQQKAIGPRIAQGITESWFEFSLKTVFFQHPFIRDACDRKPLLDLLAEFKAEIINEEEMDIEEEVRKGLICEHPQFPTNVSDPFTLVAFVIPH